MRLAALRLFVRDLPTAQSFYSDVLKLRLTRDGAEHGFLSYQSAGIDLIVETVALDAPADEQCLVGRFVGASFAVDDIHAEHARLEALGVEFTGVPEQQFWGGWLATFKDPAGNELQLAQY